MKNVYLVCPDTEMNMEMGVICATREAAAEAVVKFAADNFVFPSRKEIVAEMKEREAQRCAFCLCKEYADEGYDMMVMKVPLIGTIAECNKYFS